MTDNNIIINDYFEFKQSLEEKNKSLEKRVIELERILKKNKVSYFSSCYDYYEKLKIVYMVSLFIFSHRVMTDPYLLVKIIKTIFIKLF